MAKQPFAAEFARLKRDMPDLVKHVHDFGELTRADLDRIAARYRTRAADERERALAAEE